MNNPNPKTLYDKLWDTHFVGSRSDNGDLLYIDLHMVHEVTSPQAFEGLKIKGLGPRRVDSIVATVDQDLTIRLDCFCQKSEGSFMEDFFIWSVLLLLCLYHFNYLLYFLSAE